MSRFVILIHDHPFLHWDLLLENGDSCRTWRLLTDPGLASNDIRAEALPNHRLLYLEYEGPVSCQRGSVVQWDSGRCEWRTNLPEACEVRLEGRHWRGVLRIERSDGSFWKGARAE